MIEAILLPILIAGAAFAVFTLLQLLWLLFGICVVMPIAWLFGCVTTPIAWLFGLSKPKPLKLNKMRLQDYQGRVIDG